ncbi:MAG: response regulator [bacterium]|nr:response regulator [bacterium]
MNSSKKKILLVEDDPFLIDIYSTKLKDAGFEVLVSDEGEEAIGKIKEENPDLLLLDIVLPEIDGWEILRRIKSDEKFKNLKVIILSNLGQKEEVKKGMELGAVNYLIKAHYTPSQVVEEVKKVLKL